MEASKFNAQDTSPELQHNFCGLWNQIVKDVRDHNDRYMAYLISWDRFATCTWLCIKTPIQPQHSSPLRLATGIPFYGSPPRIQCAKSQAIVPTRHLSSTTTMPQPPSLLTTLLSSLPLPLQTRLPRRHMPHFLSMNPSNMYVRSTTKYLRLFPHNTSARRRLKVPSFLPPHRVRPLLVRYAEA
jgi:hypothetical protein